MSTPFVIEKSKLRLFLKSLDEGFSVTTLGSPFADLVFHLADNLDFVKKLLFSAPSPVPYPGLNFEESEEFESDYDYGDLIDATAYEYGRYTSDHPILPDKKIHYPEDMPHKNLLGHFATFRSPIDGKFYRSSQDPLGNPKQIQIEFEYDRPTFSHSDKIRIRNFFDEIAGFLSLLAVGVVNWPLIKAVEHGTRIRSSVSKSITPASKSDKNKLIRYRQRAKGNRRSQHKGK